LAPQVFSLFGRELEHEILRKTLGVPLNGTVQSLGFYTVEHSEVVAQQDPVLSNQ
jgi:hypothetical protein